MPSKVCSKCAGPSDGDSYCPACRSEYNRQWRASNPGYQAAAAAAWRQRNADKVAERNAARRAANAARPPRLCQDCGSPTASRHRARCEPCRAKQKAKPSGHSIRRACGWCGKAVLKSKTDANRYAKSFCSKSCAIRARPKRPPRPPEPPAFRLRVTRHTPRPCRVCRKLTIRRTYYCSKGCRSIWRRFGPRAWDRISCRECGAEWIRWQALRRRFYCSDSCRKRASRRVGRRLRRARLAAVTVEAVDLLQVAERDGWRCHICHHKVTRRTWSLDHLVPLSAGGEHSYQNTALAHHRCNTLRGATGPAQLRLAA